MRKILKPILNIQRLFSSRKEKRHERNYYKVLGVSPSSTHKEIKQRYVKLIKTTHPDITEKVNQKFQEIQTAYSVLKDPELRKNYNIELGLSSVLGDGEFEALKKSGFYSAEIPLTKNFKYQHDNNDTVYELIDNLNSQKKTISEKILSCGLLLIQLSILSLVPIYFRIIYDSYGRYNLEEDQDNNKYQIRKNTGTFIRNTTIRIL